MPTSIESFERRADAVNRLKRPSEIVYFTATVGMLDDPLYDRALQAVQRLHPDCELLSAKTLWTSASHWRATYKDLLSDVTDVYVLPYTGGIVGAGIVEEIYYLNDRPCGAPLASFFDRSLNIKSLRGFLTLPNLRLADLLECILRASPTIQACSAGSRAWSRWPSGANRKRTKAKPRQDDHRGCFSFPIVTSISGIA